MKKNVFLFALFMLCIQLLSAQITFQKIYGEFRVERGNSVVQTFDGGFIFTGQKTDSLGVNISLIKTDSTGDTLWIKGYGYLFGTTSNTRFQGEGLSVIQTNDSGYAIVGWGAIGPYNPWFLCFIKTDIDGNVIWFKTISGNEGVIGTCIKQTSDSGFILSGTYYFGTNGSFSAAFLAKTDIHGNLIWTKAFGGIAQFGETGDFVQQTNDGGYILVGETSGYSSFIPYVLLIKTNGNGDTLWTKTYGGGLGDWGTSIQQTIDGGFIITGKTYSYGIDSGDVYLIKTDSSGNLSWSKTFGGVYYEDGQCVQQVSDSGFAILAIAGKYNTKCIYFIKTDANGNLSWNKTYDKGIGVLNSKSMQQTNDGGYIIIGTSYVPGSGYAEPILIKTDDKGNSGCNEDTLETFTMVAATQVIRPSMQISTVGTIDTLQYRTVAGGFIGTITTLCYSNLNGIASINKNETSISIIPNPCSISTSVLFSFPEAQKVSVSLFDLTGKLITMLADKNFSEGENKINLNIGELNAGIYFLVIKTEKISKTEKLIVTK